MKDREPDLAFLRFRSRKVPYKYRAPCLRRNAYTRGKWHMQSVTGKSGENDPTLKHHIVTRHAEDEVRPKFKMKVTGVYGGDATKRLVRVRQ